MKISTIKSIRPIKNHAKKIIALPYDVFDYDEAKNEIEKNKNSFLKVSRSDATFKILKIHIMILYMKEQKKFK